MAFCPKCHTEVPMMARKCEHCGHKFGNALVDASESTSWAYRKFASGSIAISMLICWLYAAFGLIVAGFSIFHGQFLGALYAALSAIVAFGLSAALARVAALK